MKNRDSKGRFIKGMKMPKDLAKKSAIARTKYTSEEYIVKRKQDSKLWNINNPEKAKAKASKYRKTHKEKVNARNTKRRADKLNRTPSWLTEDDLWIIKEFYDMAILRTKATNIKHHVDHIIPLKGKNVSGLHVPNNLQVITASENVRKNNIFKGDLTWSQL